jgi:phospholipase C
MPEKEDRVGITAISLLLCSGAIVSYAQISNFSHIVVIVQENRTPDNLFQGLCAAPYGTPASCMVRSTDHAYDIKPDDQKYDIKTDNWKDKTGTVHPLPVPLANDYDLGHSHTAFVRTCDRVAGACQMDGAASIECSPVANCPTDHPQYRFVDNSAGILNPYLDLATQYGWANYMFQTNQGPSFPAHQFLFGGTSAPSKHDDAMGIFASENMNTNAAAGCTAPNGPPPQPVTTVSLIDAAGSETALPPVYPCFEHETMADKLPAPLTWRYYAPTPKSIWTAPNAIRHICVPSVTTGGGTCTGNQWIDNVDLTPADVLVDIADCNLRSVSWVIPAGYNSDHAGGNDGGGPAWVAAIVNSIGHSTSCDNNAGYWNNTAVIITWDDWGGWYDHVPPPISTLPNQGGYQYGFRVPLIVVSAYTPEHYINNYHHDFGSILRFIEHNFGIEEGDLGFADKRATTDLGSFFQMNEKPRAFRQISAPVDADFFLNDKRPATDPDND